MIFVEPTPCGHFMFGSSLIMAEGRPVLLTAARKIIGSTDHDTMRQILETLAEKVIWDLMSQASQCGFNQRQIQAMLDDVPEFPFEHR